jgi:hypothetical protein
MQQRHLLSDWPGEREWDLPVLLTNWVRYLPRRTGLREWRLPVLHTNWVRYLHRQPGLRKWRMLQHLPWALPRLHWLHRHLRRRFPEWLPGIRGRNRAVCLRVFHRQHV